MRPGNYFYERLITHGWQLPVKIMVAYHKLFSAYISTSQDGQDQIVLDLLKGKENGTFVELGGSNGVTSSNTYYLENKY